MIARAAVEDDVSSSRVDSRWIDGEKLEEIDLVPAFAFPRVEFAREPATMSVASPVVAGVLLKSRLKAVLFPAATMLMFLAPSGPRNCKRLLAPVVPERMKFSKESTAVLPSLPATRAAVKSSPMPLLATVLFNSVTTSKAVVVTPPPSAPLAVVPVAAATV